MNPVGKALWFVESHFAREITLDEIAANGDVSRFHLVRAFGLATGQPVMRYVRGRRLSEAAAHQQAERGCRQGQEGQFAQQHDRGFPA